MPKFVDITGKRYNRLVAVEYKGNGKWLFRCDCGALKVIKAYDVKIGKTVSCGCFTKEYSKLKATKHDKSNTRLYNIFCNMKSRCYNSNNPKYKSYGLRGITICKEWLDDFMNFYNWALQNGYKENLTIDRIDVNGNYCPENCRWTDTKTQANNKRDTKLITYNGITKPLKYWAFFLNMNYYSLYSRLFKRKWTVEKAFTLPIKHS